MEVSRRGEQVMMKKQKDETKVSRQGRAGRKNYTASFRRTCRIIFWLALAVINVFSPCGKAGIIIDHESVNEINNIPAHWISEAQKMLLNIPGESHSEAHRVGLILLKAIPGYEKFDASISTVPEAPTDAHLRITSYYRNEQNNNFRESAGEEDFWTSVRAVNMMQQHLTYMEDHSNPVHAFGFAWCWDMVISSPGGVEDPVYKVKWAGVTYDLNGVNHGIWGLDDEDNALTGNELNLGVYLNAVDTYNANFPETVTFFTTGTVDGYTGENGYQGYLKNEYIRAYVRNSADKVLFDYADILCYDDNGAQTTRTWTDRWDESHEFPFIASANLGDGSIGHIGQAGAVRLAKALWVLMARVAGWDGCPAVKGDFNGDCQVDLTDLVILTDCWISDAGNSYCDQVCDIAPEQSDGIVSFEDFALFSGSWMSQSCSDIARSDFSGDCAVEWLDLGLFSDTWLSGQGESNWNASCDLSPAEGDGRIDFYDFVVLAGDWQQ